MSNVGMTSYVVHIGRAGEGRVSGLGARYWTPGAEFYDLDAALDYARPWSRGRDCPPRVIEGDRAAAAMFGGYRAERTDGMPQERKIWRESVADDAVEMLRSSDALGYFPKSGDRVTDVCAAVESHEVQTVAVVRTAAYAQLGGATPLCAAFVDEADAKAGYVGNDNYTPLAISPGGLERLHWTAQEAAA